MVPEVVANLLSVFRRAYSLSPGPGNPWPLFAVSLKGILLNRKKTPLLLGFLLLPLVVTLFISGELENYRSETTVMSDVGDATGGRAWFQDILGSVFFPLLIPIVTAVYATGAIGEEVEGKTLPYIFTRPIFRSWTLLAKSISSFAASIVLGCVAVTVTFFVALSIGDNPFDHLGELFGYWTAVALAVLATGGLFLLVGVLMKQAVIVIVIYTFVWETILGNILPSEVLKYSFVWYERAYINSFIGRQPGFVTGLLVDVPSGAEAVTVMLFLGIVGILASLFVVSYRDYNV